MQCVDMGKESRVGEANTYLGEREETLGDGDDILHLLNRLNAVLDNLGVLGAGGVEDVADALDVTLCPVPVGLLHRLESFGSVHGNTTRDRARGALYPTKRPSA